MKTKKDTITIYPYKFWVWKQTKFDFTEINDLETYLNMYRIFYYLGVPAPISRERYYQNLDNCCTVPSVFQEAPEKCTPEFEKIFKYAVEKGFIEEISAEDYLKGTINWDKYK